MVVISGGSGRTTRWRRSRPSPHDSEVLLEMLREVHWPYLKIQTDPRGQFSEPVEDGWRYIISQYADDDVLWIGRDIRDSGSPAHKRRFRTAAEWMTEKECPGTFICPNTFRPGVYRRSNENVLRTAFLVVESDELTRDEVGAVFRWIEEAYPELTLRAVVDTAGKSLHGWFDYPSPETFAQLRDFLPRLKCDPAMFTPCQPCRLPSAVRDGRPQRLIYFNPKPATEL